MAERFGCISHGSAGATGHISIRIAVPAVGHTIFGRSSAVIRADGTVGPDGGVLGGSGTQRGVGVVVARVVGAVVVICVVAVVSLPLSLRQAVSIAAVRTNVIAKMLIRFIMTSCYFFGSDVVFPHPYELDREFCPL